MQFPQSFYKSLEAGLDKRHNQDQYFRLGQPAEQLGLVDFGSNDSLSLRLSDIVRERFIRQLDENTNFALGAGGSRVLDGSHRHAMELERDIAAYHGAETSLLFNSGYEANRALFGLLPRPGDALVHDAKIHASIIDGIRTSRASIIKGFEHNDVGSLGQIIDTIKDMSSDILQGKRTVFVALESFYSMEGDMSPVREMLDRARSALPAGNMVFLIDEAHSTGLIGPQGAGYIRYLGLEKESIIQMHSYAKGPGALGAAVLCPPVVKEYLTNYARSVIYSTGPSFPTVATIRASIDTLRSPEGDRRRKQLSRRIRLFYTSVIQHPLWEPVQESGVLSIPGTEKIQNEIFCHIPIIPIITGRGLCVNLQNELGQHGFLVHALHYPVVAKDAERIRLMMHITNTNNEICRLVDVLLAWASSASTADSDRAKL